MATDFANWVNELESIRPGKGKSLSSINSSGRKEDRQESDRDKHEKTIEELEQEMKLLHWHKLANEAALKAALIKTKRLKQTDPRTVSNQNSMKEAEKSQWMKSIIEEERNKPLQVDEDFIRKYEKEEAEDDERVEREVQRHIQSLKKVKTNIKNRQEVKRRNQVYRAKTKLINSPHATQETLNFNSLLSGGSLNQLTSSQNNTPRSHKSSTSSQAANGTLGKVLTSLDMLVDLEKRIALLERDDHNQSMQSSRSSTGSRSRARMNAKKKVLFSKKRTNSSVTNPADSYYRMKIATTKRRRAQPTFLTSLPDSNASTHSSSRRTQKSRNPSSRQSFKSRLASAQDKDAAVSNWLKEKDAAKAARRQRIQASRSQATARSRNARSTAATSTRSSRSTSRAPKKAVPLAKDHLKSFHETRRQYDKKKRTMHKSIHAAPSKRVIPRNTRLAGVTGLERRKKNDSAGSGAVSRRKFGQPASSAASVSSSASSRQYGSRLSRNQSSSIRNTSVASRKAARQRLNSNNARSKPAWGAPSSSRRSHSKGDNLPSLGVNGSGSSGRATTKVSGGLRPRNVHNRPMLPALSGSGLGRSSNRA